MKGTHVSLAIDVDAITEVLLQDGWHSVLNASFTLDAYEFVQNTATAAGESSLVLHGGGEAGVCSTGFSFESNDGHIAGPLTAIQAVKSL